jgi:Domain of unknown function (DUF4062)
MELFPAADDDTLTLIKSVIDDSDYYVIILGGRYGTRYGTLDKQGCRQAAIRTRNIPDREPQKEDDPNAG